MTCPYTHEKLPAYGCWKEEGHNGDHSLIRTGPAEDSTEQIIRFALVLARLKLAMQEKVNLALSPDDISDLFYGIKMLTPPKAPPKAE